MVSKSGESVQERLLHDRVVREVAESRFGLDGWEVTTFSDSDLDGGPGSRAPDIVATSSGVTVAIGAVETLDSVCDERAKQWKAFGESCSRFYLYIPRGSEEEVAGLIAKHKVPCAGVRTYAYNGRLEVESVYMDEAYGRDDDHPWWVAIGGSHSN